MVGSAFRLVLGLWLGLDEAWVRHRIGLVSGSVGDLSLCWD